MKKLYSPEFKAKTVNAYLKGKSISELAQENNLSRTTIYEWIDEAQEKENTNRSSKPLNWRSSTEESIVLSEISKSP